MKGRVIDKYIELLVERDCAYIVAGGIEVNHVVSAVHCDENVETNCSVSVHVSKCLVKHVAGVSAG